MAALGGPVFILEIRNNGDEKQLDYSHRWARGGGGTGGEFPPRTSISYLVTYVRTNFGLIYCCSPPDGQPHAHL